MVNIREDNAMLTQGNRRYLKDKSGLSRSAQSQHRSEIRKRVLHTFLDFMLLEESLEEEERERIFKAVDANYAFDDGGEDPDLDIDPGDRVTCLSDMLAFVYRETRSETGHHPPFLKLLEHAIIQGENDPGETYYGNYDVTIEIEEVERETVNFKAIAERLKRGDVDQLTEAEKEAYLEAASQIGAYDPDEVVEEIDRLAEEYEEKHGMPPTRASWLLAGEPRFLDE